jgi:hypothetical protein
VNSKSHDAGSAKTQKFAERTPRNRVSILAIAIALEGYTGDARPNAANPTFPNAICYLISDLRNAEAPPDKRVVQKYVQTCVSYSARSDFRRLMMLQVSVMKYAKVSGFVNLPTGREQLQA